jgi:gamma-glutamylcyclotransferase (GGCT)/AIG2-like uncharacterized protein YtfP
MKTPAPLKLIFVYGTLKRGCSNHHFLAGQKFVGEARTAPGFRLFELEGHPGLVPRKEDRDGVAGEVWSVDDAALVRLDALEGLDEGTYRREVIPLAPPFADQGIEGYVYNRSVVGRRDLGGVWEEKK